MKRKAVWFRGAEQVEVREDDVPVPLADEVLVKTVVSAISPGTEMLFYRGSVPAEMAVDETIGALHGMMQFPLQYGYACVGEVVQCGSQVDSACLGRRVFAFHPHESHFRAKMKDLLVVPDDISLEDAAFLPNMETAVNFVMDGQPLLGERVVVLGLGIVGLLTTALLVQFPLGSLVALDRYPGRRAAAQSLGNVSVLDPAGEDVQKFIHPSDPQAGADLVFELSGRPETLNLAIDLAGFAGRVVIGSWYGTKPGAINLGGKFHRSRIRLISSQVSSLAPALTGRWTKERRMEVAWNRLRMIQPARWVTQRFAVDQAEEAYQLLANAPQETIQVLFTYPDVE